MALEDAINKNTATLEVLINILQSGGVLTASAAPKAAPGPVVTGDPKGTLYFVDDANTTVYAQKPGDPDPQVDTMKPATAKEYSAAKVKYAKKDSTAGATAAPSGASAASPASATPAAGNASAPDWSDVVVELTKLNKDESDKGGRPALLALIAEFMPKAKKVTELESLNKNAEILAWINARLGAEPETAADDTDLGI